MIQQRRLQLKLTQGQVGAAMTPRAGAAYVSALERGRKTGRVYLGSAVTYARVAVALGMTPWEWGQAAEGHYTGEQRSRLRAVAHEMAIRMPPTYQEELDAAVRVLNDLRASCSPPVFRAALTRCGLMVVGVV